MHAPACNQGPHEGMFLFRMVPCSVASPSTTTDIHKCLLVIFQWLRDEVAAWHAQQHPHVARLFGLIRLDDGSGSGNDGDDVWLGMVSSWCENGTIMQYLVKHPLADRLRLVRTLPSVFLFG